MLSAVSDLQNSAVTELVNLSLTQDIITFKAPTGSGKTYMMADLMDRYLADYDDVIFLVSTLSKGELAQQSYDAFLTYGDQGKFKHLKPYLICTETSSEERVYIPDNYNVYILPDALNKKTGKIVTQGALSEFLKRITSDRFHQGLGKRIFLIKDECHIQKKRLDIDSSFFSKIFNFSATPDLSKNKKLIPDVEITETDAINTKLIKEVQWCSETDSLADALDKYLSIEDQYENLLGIRPCMIIEVSNSLKGANEWEEIIEPALATRSLQWMYIVGDEKQCKTNSNLKDKPVSLWKKYAKEKTSLIEVIVFKLAISEGWDIPRACMLYQIRSTESETLAEQVLGRVRRNPILLEYEKYQTDAQNLSTKCWVWGRKEKDATQQISVRIASENTQNEIKVIPTIIREDFLTYKNFELAEHLKLESDNLVERSIFELFKDASRANDSIKNLQISYVDSYDKWFKFTKNIKEISAAFNKHVGNYKNSMDVLRDEKGNPQAVMLPSRTSYLESPSSSSLYLPNSIWRRLDGDETFTFDSEAERDFAMRLQVIAPTVVKIDTSKLEHVDETYLWGRNFPSTEIRFAYYSNGIHFSYPDFVLKDKFDRIHLFEVKSLNDGGRLSDLQKEMYEEKIHSLSEAYLAASKLTNHVFYLPIKFGSDWQIHKFDQGKHEKITFAELKIYLGELVS